MANDSTIKQCLICKRDINVGQEHKCGINQENKTAKQLVPQLKPYQWKKGQSGNPKGGKPGKTLKTFAREYLMSLPDDEKVEYLASLPTDIVWKMAEGNPTNDDKLNVSGNIDLISIVNKANGPDTTNAEVDTKPD